MQKAPSFEGAFCFVYRSQRVLRATHSAMRSRIVQVLIYFFLSLLTCASVSTGGALRSELEERPLGTAAITLINGS